MDHAEAFGEDIGQNSWLTSDEHDLFIDWMSLTNDSRVLDVACGSGYTTLRIAEARAYSQREALSASCAHSLDPKANAGSARTARAPDRAGEPHRRWRTATQAPESEAGMFPAAAADVEATDSEARE